MNITRANEEFKKNQNDWCKRWMSHRNRMILEVNTEAREKHLTIKCGDYESEDEDKCDNNDNDNDCDGCDRSNNKGDKND